MNWDVFFFKSVLKHPVCWRSTQIWSVTKFLWFDGEHVRHKPILSFTFVYLWSQMTKLREFYRSAVFFKIFGFRKQQRGKNSLMVWDLWHSYLRSESEGAKRRCTMWCALPIFVWRFFPKLMGHESWVTTKSSSDICWQVEKIVMMMIDDSGYYDDFDSNLVCENSKTLFDGY